MIVESAFILFTCL